MRNASAGGLSDVLYFRARANPERVIALHPNVFHRLLETAPATGWKVVQDDRGISVNPTGLREEAGRFQIEIGVRKPLEAEGVEVPPIRVDAVAELRRGKTGKAPLMVRLSAPGLPRG
jgi:hypothetical protein